MSEIVNPSRRGLILGAVFTLITAPAIVRATSIMAVKPFGVLETIGFDAGVGLDTETYIAQYRAFQKAFLADYRKAPTAEAARDFNVVEFASKGTGSEIRPDTLGRASPRAMADDGPFWNIEAHRGRILERNL